MSLFSRIVRKIARRFRRKGVMAERMNRPGRNSKPDTAVDLWERKYRFKETPPLHAGTNRRMAREARERKART